jgi:hypothetical protein
VVGDGSCAFGERSCFKSEGSIGDTSCLGEGSCRENKNFILGPDSCQGESSCTDNRGVVMARSCVGRFGCYANNETIGEDSVCDVPWNLRFGAIPFS